MVSALLTQVSSRGKTAFGGISMFLRSNPLLTGAALGVGAIVATQSILGVARRKKRRTTTRRAPARRKTTRKKKRGNGTLRKHRTPPAKRKIRFTKKGQPFIITKSGKAKFIKKSSARSAKKRKGGFR